MQPTVDDVTLVEALLADPPRRELLPAAGPRPATVAELRQRQRLFRALSITDHAAVRELLTAGLTEPFSRERGSLAPVPLAATSEAARTARWAFARGFGTAEVRERLLGLQTLHAALDGTAPDSWRVYDVAEVICNWHRAQQPVAEIHRLILAAEALWASDASELGQDRAYHFRNFVAALIEVF